MTCNRRKSAGPAKPLTQTAASPAATCTAWKSQDEKRKRRGEATREKKNRYGTEAGPLRLLAGPTDKPSRPADAKNLPHGPRGGLPREARDGLMRAWVAILHERHPNVTWLPLERPRQGRPVASAATPAAGNERLRTAA